MLDWDAKIQNQPDNVKAALKEMFPAEDYQRFVRVGATGAELHSELMRRVTGTRGTYAGPDRELSELFASKGVPGVKYYDQWSRFTREGGGKTRNYVTWDQDVLDRTAILENGMDLLGNKIK